MELERPLDSTLLQRALADNRSRNEKDASVQEVELALAWLEGRINGSQVQRVLRKQYDNKTYYHLLARALRTAFRQNRLTLLTMNR